MNRAVFVYHKDTYNAYDAQRIVFEASKYKSEIIFEDGTKRGNAKSIIGLLSMKFLKGDEYVVYAEGADSRAAARAIADFVSEL